LSWQCFLGVADLRAQTRIPATAGHDPKPLRLHVRSNRREDEPMPALTRRRDRNVPQECCQCVGNSGAAKKWQWRCGFYQGSRPGECRTAPPPRSMRRVAFENLLRRNRFSAPGMPPYYQPGRTTSPERLAAPGQSHARVVLSESPLVYWELIGRCRLELCCFVGVG
jgi:hypothetical protein